MKKLKLLLAALTLGVAFNACDKKADDTMSGMCVQQVIIDDNAYKTAPLAHVDKLEIIDNCLLMEVSGSGCSESSWTAYLLADEGLMYSNPPQRGLRVVLDYYGNEATCMAYFTKLQSFDISSIRLKDTDVLLRIEGYDDVLLLPRR
jgi:hypothetical protein